MDNAHIFRDNVHLYVAELDKDLVVCDKHGKELLDAHPDSEVFWSTDKPCELCSASH